MNYTIAQQIAQLVGAIQQCALTGNAEWGAKHSERLRIIERNYLPSGAGFDNGTRVDVQRSTPEKLVFTTAFHHMNDAGYYDGWTEHTVTAKPSFLLEVSLTISGPDRNAIKDYMYETFRECLTQRVSVLQVDLLATTNKGADHERREF
jgi:hypothetical protein